MSKCLALPAEWVMAKEARFSSTPSGVPSHELHDLGWEEAGRAVDRILGGQWSKTLLTVVDAIKKPTHELLGKPCPWIPPTGT